MDASLWKRVECVPESPELLMQKRTTLWLPLGRQSGLPAAVGLVFSMQAWG